MRIRVLALAGALLLPAAAHAQTGTGYVNPNPNVLPFARFAVTPFVGIQVPYGASTLFLLAEDGTQYQVESARGGGAAAGLMVEGQVLGPLSVVVAGTYAAGDGDDTSIFLNGDRRFLIRTDGPSMVFAKAGVSYRLPEPSPDVRRFHPLAAVTVAPAVVWTRPRGFSQWPEEVNRTNTHFALNLGLDAAQRLGSRGLALHFGFEDYITFWNTGGLRAADEIFLGDVVQQDVAVVYDRTYNHLMVLRAGLSFRF
jgi:hypothetical protein